MEVAIKGRRRKPAASGKVQARRGRPPRAISVASSAGTSLLSKVEGLIASNKALSADIARVSKENDELKALLGKIERALKDSPAAQTSPAPVADPAAPARTRKGSAVKRIRRPITDPAVLDRRRAGMAKARAALAAKRTAAAA